MPTAPHNPTLGYCTNVHPGTSLAQVKQQLETHAVRVRELLGRREPLPVGLWFAADVARELSQPGAVGSFRDWLGERGLLPYTLNGFPFGNFHEAVVKHAVYEPDWTTPARLDYTVQLAELLAVLRGDAGEGSISTLPIGWPRGGDETQRLGRAGQLLLKMVDTLKEIEARSGKWIHVNLEPEPGCVLDTADDIVRFFKEHVLRHASDEQAARRYLGVCHDVCHSAVMFEPQARAIETYTAAGLRVGKVQVSAAVRADFDRMDDVQRSEAVAQLSGFSEPRYLHQTAVRRGGAIKMYQDLPDALAASKQAPPSDPWRVHFHVPIHVAAFGELASTQDDIGRCLQALRAHGDTRHFEVETYAWSVLPEAMRAADLAAGIADELRWLHGQQGQMESEQR